MKISLQWLSQFVEIPKDLSPKKIGELFTVRTAEVEGVIEEGQAFENMVVGLAKTVKPHPNADKLRIAETDIGSQTVQIVCGGVNLKEGMKVAVALPGARVKWHGEGDLITLEKTKIRGEESVGMICAGEEIGLPAGGEHEIIDLEKQKIDKELLKPGTPLAQALGKNDIILEVDNKSLTHRPDLWGHYGIAREMAAIFNAKLKPYEKAMKLAKNEDFGTDTSALKIEVESKEIITRMSCAVITGITVKQSPEWLKRDLIAAGVRPVNNIVDVTNYVMLGLGQPMHAFDRNDVGHKLIIRRAKKDEKVETLDHKMRTLTEQDIVVANEKNILALGGIIGGVNSEIHPETTEIILEAGTWKASLIRKTSTRLNVRTDAVQRYEKSLDPLMTEMAIRQACALIKKLCPKASITSPLLDVDYSEKTPKKVTINPAKVCSMIGTQIEGKEMIDILKRLQFKVAKTVGPAKEKLLKVEIPSWRATKDVGIEADIVEEIARLYGYEKIPAKLPKLPARLPHQNTERMRKHRAREILSHGLGFNEVYNYSFYSKEDFKKALLPEEKHLKLKNVLSEDQSHMRMSLVPNMLKNIEQNSRFFPEFKTYEIGHIYEEVGQYFPKEEKWICGAIVQPASGSGKITSMENIANEPFFQAKGALETFLQHFGNKNFATHEGISHPCAHPKKSLAYSESSDEVEFARVYEVHPTVLKNFGLEKKKIALFEISLQKITETGLQQRYRPIPRFPGIEIDISILMDEKKQVKDIENLMRVSPLVKRIELFDLYSGNTIEAGKKSVTFKILLQSDERTLTDEEMKEIQSKIFDNIQKTGSTIRGL
jgi:phenylalanyl-tRNA synthetase beta chain